MVCASLGWFSKALEKNWKAILTGRLDVLRKSGMVFKSIRHVLEIHFELNLHGLLSLGSFSTALELERHWFANLQGYILYFLIYQDLFSFLIYQASFFNLPYQHPGSNIPGAICASTMFNLPIYQVMLIYPADFANLPGFTFHLPGFIS